MKTMCYLFFVSGYALAFTIIFAISGDIVPAIIDAIIFIIVTIMAIRTYRKEVK